MSKMIKAVIKRPNSKPYMIRLDGSLEVLQVTVGGYIEIVPIASDLVVICDEEGKLKGKPYNCTICGEPFVGDLIFCGVDGEDLADLPCDFSVFKTVFRNLWEEVSA